MNFVIFLWQRLLILGAVVKVRQCLMWWGYRGWQRYWGLRYLRYKMLKCKTYLKVSNL